MCGIFGVVSKKGRFDSGLCKTALETLIHRGPDDWGLEHFPLVGSPWEVWLGQRRLSILDLSQAGRQPMTSQLTQGMLTHVVYNGEIYNHQQLREEFRSRWDFRSRSDTEVLLAGLTLAGTDFLRECNGMFAIAFFNETQRSVTLARDRIGKKPLYLYRSDDCIVFSSELKSIVALGVPLTVNSEAMAYYRWLGYIPADRTVYNECVKVKAGYFLTLELASASLNRVTETMFWDPLARFDSKFTGSYQDAVHQFLELLDDSTQLRQTADVPVGVFLSGGIDSSLVASSIETKGVAPVRAFSVKFDDPDFDESPVAQETAQKLGIPLDLISLTQNDFDRQVNCIPRHFDEPFSDSSQIPMLAISEAASRSVKVVLTGDGGDEIFLGYPRFSFQRKFGWLCKFVSSMPSLSKCAAQTLESKTGQRALKFAFESLGVNSNNIDAKSSRLVDILSLQPGAALYDAIMSTRPRRKLSPNDQQSLGKKALWTLANEWYPNASWEALEGRSQEEQFAALDMITYMRDDVLVKVDRATMAYSLEARSPLLDYRIIEFGQSLPSEFKLKNNIHKRLLRDALALRLHGKTSKLQKRGFGVPLPENLPEGQTKAARWNIFVERQWKQHFGFS